MPEAIINSNYNLYQERRAVKAQENWPLRLRYWLDRVIYKDETEYLEQPGIPFKIRYSVVEKLSRLNDFSGYHFVLLRYLNRIQREIRKREGFKKLRILDIGAGGGGLLKSIYRWAQKRDIPVELVGIDASPEFVVATEFNLRKRGIPVTMFRADENSIRDIPDSSFDIVLSSYVVHHIRSAGKVAKFLSEAHRIARHGWLIADFDRRFYGPALVAAIGFCLSGSWILTSDGIKSIQRAYTTAEMNYILKEWHKLSNQNGMKCESYPLLPYWMIYGLKSDASSS